MLIYGGIISILFVLYRNDSVKSQSFRSAALKKKKKKTKNLIQALLRGNQGTPRVFFDQKGKIRHSTIC